MSENQSIQGKVTSTIGLKKDLHKTSLKDGEYHHMKNGIVSSFEGDVPYVQNAPSNERCGTFPEGYIEIGSEYIKERNFHVVFLVNPIFDKSEIGYFYPDECRYETKFNSCFNFKVNYPIKAKYKYWKCQLIISFQDGYNRDRRINMDDPPYVKIVEEGECPITTDVFDCEAINIQNDLTPPVVKITNVNETGNLRTGVYQFAVCYANINGDEQSSYYSKTNIVPIFVDRFGSYESVEGSEGNVLTNKSIQVTFENIDSKYDYINLAVIKTIQGTPTYEVVATLPISVENYIYTGRETTRLLSADLLLGLYPDYYNSKTITSANNFLIRGNLSTQDETNYQPLASLIQLEWIITRKKADVFDSSYKNPLNTTDYLGYQRGEVYPFGIQFLLSNGRKTSVFHIPGREAKPGDLIKYTKDNIPYGQECNFYEFEDKTYCQDDNSEELFHWQIYDTATIDYELNETLIDACSDEVIKSGDFAYWESTINYPCNEEVYSSLSGKKIRHHKFPSNNLVHHHNAAFAYSASGVSVGYENPNTYIYPMGVRLKGDNLLQYINQAISFGLISQEEADLISGYELVRGDRTGNKSIIAKGLLYNMKDYVDVNPSTGEVIKKYYPNYPFNDLREDPFITSSNASSTDTATVNIPADGTATYKLDDGNYILANAGDVFNNPFPEDIKINLPDGLATFTPTVPFTIVYEKVIRLHPTGVHYAARFNFYPPDDEDIRNFTGVSDSFASDYTPATSYQKSIFTFHSPDTHFKQPFLGQELNLHSLEFGTSLGRFDKVEGHPLLKPAIISGSSNYACAFKSVGDYSSFIPVTNSNLRRRLVDASYLVANSDNKFQTDPNVINNRFRESSVGIITNCDISDPTIIDESRWTVSSNDKCECKIKVSNKIMNCKDSFEVDSQCTEDYKYISSYYGSLKAKIPNQYGSLESIKYVLTGKYHNVFEKKPVFGGDTFITRFSLKRKHSFFKVNFIGLSPVGMTYRDKKYHNVISPIYTLSNERGGILKQYVIDGGSSHLDCGMGDCNIFTGGTNNGFLYLFNTGIVNFFAESSINTELRYSEANIQDTWFPKLKDTNLYDWMEEVKVSINFDNTYYYNFDYSKQNIEESLFTQAADFVPNTKCKNSHPRRIIYSKQSSEEETSDSWIIYPANNYYDADSNLGSITDIEALDSQKVLVRYENGSQVFNAFDTLQLDRTSVTVGTGGMFSQRPQSFLETDTGYAGSKAKWAFNTSQFGSFFIDNERNKIFQFSGQLDEISNAGMFNWFYENIPLKFDEILKKLSGKINIEKFNKDNPFLGVGFCSIFDNRFNLWFLTKKDYILKNDNELKNLTFDEFGTLLYKGKVVNFNDENIWENVGWTASYSPIYKSWISFHSFQPNYYMEGINKFYSGEIYNNYFYSHWSKNNFQEYFNRFEPFEVRITTASEQENSIFHTVEYVLKVQKYLNGNYQDIVEDHKINFSKLIISSDNQSSGILNIVMKDNSKPYESLKYPIVNIDSIDVLCSRVEGHKFRINQFVDIVRDKNNSIPIFLNSKNGVDRTVNNVDYQKVKDMRLGNQKFRGEFCDVTFIQDQTSDYKYILKLIFNKTLKSSR